MRSTSKYILVSQPKQKQPSIESQDAYPGPLPVSNFEAGPHADPGVDPGVGPSVDPGVDPEKRRFFDLSFHVDPGMGPALAWTLA